VASIVLRYAEWGTTRVAFGARLTACSALVRFANASLHHPQNKNTVALPRLTRINPFAWSSKSLTRNQEKSKRKAPPSRVARTGHSSFGKEASSGWVIVSGAVIKAIP
jgi:hypothetical protein